MAPDQTQPLPAVPPGSDGFTGQAEPDLYGQSAQHGQSVAYGEPLQRGEAGQRAFAPQPGSAVPQRDLGQYGASIPGASRPSGDPGSDPSRPSRARRGKPPRPGRAPTHSPESGQPESGGEQVRSEAAAASPRRTGSPIIAPGVQPAAITAALCLVIALAAALGRPALGAAVILLQAITAAGWFRLNGMWPARQGILLGFAAGVTADIALLAMDGTSAPAVALGTLGVWCLAILAQQLRQRGGGDERLYGLTVTVSAAVVTVLAVGHLAAWSVGQSGGSDSAQWSNGAPVVVGAVAVAFAVLLRAMPVPPLAACGLALVAAAASGAIVGRATEVGAAGMLLGLAAGGCALLGLRVASYDYPSRFVHFTAGVSLPITAAAPVIYMVGRLLAG